MWEALKHNPEGLTFAQVKNQSEYEYIDHYSRQLDELSRPEIRVGRAIDVIKGIESDLKFEFVFARNLFTRLYKEEELLLKLKEHLTDNGEIHFSEGMPSEGSTLSEFVKDENLKSLLNKAEEKVYHDPDNPMTNWNKYDMLTFFSTAFANVIQEELTQKEERSLDEETLSSWWEKSYLKHLTLSPAEKDKYKQILLKELAGKSVRWRHSILLLTLSNSSPKKEKAED